MSQQKNSLFEAFHADHALLGRGFYELSQALRSNDVAAAQKIAQRIDAEAGAHVAFEEDNFYPALRPLLGEADVERMYREHDRGLEVLRAVMEQSSQQPLGEAERAQLLRQSETMETHIAECGDLFGAMGRIPPEEQAELHRQLLAWRDRRPGWSDFAASRVPRPPDRR